MDVYATVTFDLPGVTSAQRAEFYNYLIDQRKFTVLCDITTTFKVYWKNADSVGFCKKYILESLELAKRFAKISSIVTYAFQCGNSNTFLGTI